MKKLIFLILAIILMLVSCKEDVIEKPKNLIDRKVMVDIIYDLAIFEATKSQLAGTYQFPRTTQFLKEKYKVDSLTFANSSQYYASDIKEYKKMYDEVKERLKTEKVKLNGGKPVVQNMQKGVVK